jgi:hypothetical protein
LIGTVVEAKRAHNAWDQSVRRCQAGDAASKSPQACIKIGWWETLGVMDCTACARCRICAIARKQPASTRASHSLEGQNEWKYYHANMMSARQPDGHVAQQAHTGQGCWKSRPTFEHVHENQRINFIRIREIISTCFKMGEKKRTQSGQVPTVTTAATTHMTAVAASAFAQADLAASLVNAKFLSTEAASSTMCSSRGLARSSDTRKGSKPKQVWAFAVVWFLIFRSAIRMNCTCRVELISDPSLSAQKTKSSKTSYGYKSVAARGQRGLDCCQCPSTAFNCI